MPDGAHRPTNMRLARLMDDARSMFPATDLYVAAAVAWVSFIAPEKAGHEPADPELLALHTALVGFDDRYYAGLLRLFARLGMTD